MDCQYAFFPVNAILIIFTVKLTFHLSRDRMLMVLEQPCFFLYSKIFSSTSSFIPVLTTSTENFIYLAMTRLMIKKNFHGTFCNLKLELFNEFSTAT